MHDRLVENLNYAVIFSIKTILALSLQTAIQFVVGKSALDLDIHSMFLFFATVSFGAFGLSLIVCLGELLHQAFNHDKSK